jgi:hypothetical protein
MMNTQSLEEKIIIKIGIRGSQEIFIPLEELDQEQEWSGHSHNREFHWVALRVRAASSSQLREKESEIHSKL